MNGKLQGIIIGGVCVACLAGVMVFLQQTGKDENGAESSSSSSASTSSKESIVILSKSSDDIDSVKITNTTGEYTLSIPSSGKSSWSIEELVGISQNTTMKSSLLANCGGVEASKLVEENVSDMSKYGLENPAGTGVITYKDGTTATVKVGNFAPNSTSQRYVTVDDDKKVYLFAQSKAQYFLGSVNDYVSTTLIAQPATDDDWPEYGTETISRKDIDYDIVFEQDTTGNASIASQQVMTQPIFAYLNVSNSTSATHGMWGLTADSCELVNPTDEDKKNYGITDPTATVTLKGDSYDYTLYIGNPVYQEGSNSNETDVIGGYYCFIEGVKEANCIYVISADNLPWATLKPEDVMSTLMTANYLANLTNVKISYDDKAVDYAVTNEGGSTTEINEDPSNINTTKVVADGNDVDVAQFKTFYQYILTCPNSEIYFEEPTDDVYMTIDLVRNDGTEDKMELYKDTSRRYILKLNGVTSYRIQSGWVDTLISNMDKLANGGTVEDTY